MTLKRTCADFGSEDHCRANTNILTMFMSPPCDTATTAVAQPVAEILSAVAPAAQVSQRRCKCTVQSETCGHD